MFDRAICIYEDNTKFVLQEDGLKWTFYKGDKNFANCKGVDYSARKLASMTDHVARFKDGHKVYWCAEIYFASILNKANNKPIRTTKHNKRSAKDVRGKRLSVKHLKVVA